MSGDQPRRLDHVVLPRRVPGLALLERYFPSPAANLLDAELTAFARPGDTILDPWAGTGWTARRSIALGMRSISADPSPFAQLAARALLQAPEASAIDAALGQLAASRRVDVPLAQHVEELYATRCPACRHPVVADQFIWPRSGDAPARKVYRCDTCDVAVGGPSERSAPVDEIDLAKLGIEHGASDEEADPIDAEDDEELPPAPVGLTDDPAAPLGEAGGPPPPSPLPTDPPLRAPANDPRWASTVRPSAPAAPAGDPGDAHHVQQLRDRFPVLDGREELIDELLELYTPRNLYAIQAIANKIDAELRNDALAALFRLALAACLLPASRLNGYPGRVASLRIAGGHVRQPASRHQREVNVWRLFTAAVTDVRTAVAALGHERRPARFASDLEELGGVGAANVLWIRCRPAVVGQYVPPDSVDMVLGSAGAPASIDELSFEYLATAWLMGREAAGTLRLEPLFGAAALHADGVEPAALRRAMTSAAGALKADGWCNVLLDGDDPERLVAVAIAGSAAGLDLADVIHRESRTTGDGVVIHFRKPIAGEGRLRDAGGTRPLRLGADHDQLTYPELATAMERAVVALLRDRGEPAGLTRLTAAVLIELERSGLLRRLASLRSGEREADEASGERLDGSGHAILTQLLREELWRDDHPVLVRLEDEARPAWWLREPELAESPLADRVEWATFSVLTTAGRLDEAAFMDRIYGLFPGLHAPDEELVRTCLAAYARVAENGQLRTEEELAGRLADHARVLATVVDVGHRLGMRVWLSRREQARPWGDGTLGDLLRDEERRAYLPLIVRAPADALGEIDAIWYVRGRFAFLLEVEWTGMLGEPVLRRGRRIEAADDQVRLLLLPAERTELLRRKVERSPWLRAELDRQNWRILKWQHLDTLAGREGIRLEWLEPLLGLDPLIERGGEQLTMFGE